MTKKPLVVSIFIILSFLGLMIYALNHNPNILPSELVGKPAPIVSAKTVRGSNFSLQEVLKDKRWVILNFWSTTCVVCRVEAPELERFYSQLSASAPSASQNAPHFVSINIQESPPEVLKYQQNFRQTFDTVLDSAGKISLDFGVTGTPETFFISPEGVVRHRVAGEVDSEGILRFIEWLEKNPAADSLAALEGFANLRNSFNP
jgi:cytochrome c biogenesis protein CcmG, thiol:disulfide interchange protein DsbE